MDRSSASSKISFHGLPRKNKCPSIRKHSVVVIITVNSFYEKAICREIFSKYFFARIFPRIRQNSNSASKYVTKNFGNFTEIHPWQSLMLVKLQAFNEANTGCVL